MRKIIQLLHSTFGSQHNADINTIVSAWFYQKYSIKELGISLDDVKEEDVVSAISNFIVENEISFDELKHLVVVPYLSENRFDLNARVIVMPELIIKRLGDYCKIEAGFWSANDEVTNTGGMSHISVVKGAAGEMLGGFVNGTFSDGDAFSVPVMSEEIMGSLEFGLDKGLNGVQVSESIKDKLKVNVLLARMLDSAVGYRLIDNVDSEQLIRMLKIREVTGEAADCKVFSSWGQMIGKKLRLFSLDDKLINDTAHTEAAKRIGRLVLVTDNKEKAAQPIKVQNSDSCDTDDDDLTWGKF